MKSEMQLKENTINAKEFANITGMHFNTVYKMIRRGDIKAIKDGKSYVIPYAEAERFSLEMSNTLIKEVKYKLDVYKELEKEVAKILYEASDDLVNILISTNKIRKNKNGVYGGNLYEHLRNIKQYIDVIERAREHYKSVAYLSKHQEILYKKMLSNSGMENNNVQVSETILNDLQKY